jgi:hypothetical protein
MSLFLNNTRVSLIINLALDNPPRHNGLRPMKRFVSLLLLLFSAIPAYPQRITASLAGDISDPSGAGVPNATVQMTNTGTSEIFSETTDQGGHFLVPALPPGHYDLSIEASGFKRLERKDLILNVDQSVSLRLVMQLGKAVDTVEVTGDAPLLETESAAVGQAVNNKSIVDLPLNQRNPFSLILLVPGVTGSSSAINNGLSFNVNGGRQGTTDVLLDGVPSAPPNDSFNALTIFPSVDAVQEFKVQTSGYPAEFGRSGGGIINLVYKSGANQLHGSAYDFLRNSVMDSNDFFSNRSGVPLASFKRNQFGFSLGGPVLLPKLYDGRNKTFFFVDYEGLRQRQASSVLTTVPTAAERSGDFSQDTTSAGKPIAIYDPHTTVLQPNGNYLRQLYAGNKIPATQIDKVAANVSQYWPLPDITGTNGSSINNYFATGSAATNINQYDVKGDQIISERQRLSIRLSQRNPTSTPAQFFPSAIAVALPTTSSTQDGLGGVLNYTFAISPTHLLEFRYGVTRLNIAVQSASDGFDPTKLGFPSYIRDSANFLTFPAFVPSGYLQIGGGASGSVGNLAVLTHTWELSDTKVFSHHNLKFGVETRLDIANANQVGKSTGDFTFSPSFTQGPNALTASGTAGDSFASFLTGLGAGTLTHNFKIIDTLSHYWAGYIQDDYKATSKLTVNVGLRYDLFLPRTERHDRANYLDLTSPSPLAGPSGIPNLVGGLGFVGVNGAPNTQTNTNYMNFAPRFGFAYHPLNRLVVRGGYGIFFTSQPTEAAATIGSTGFRTDSPFLGTIDGATPNNYLSNPYPGGAFVPVSGSSLGLLTSVGAGIGAPFRHSPSTYSQNWNVGLQYQLPGNWLVDVSYVASRGDQLLWDPNYNQLPVSDLALGAALLQTLKNPFAGLITTAGPLAGTIVQKRYLMTAYPQFTSVDWSYQPGANSFYNSLQVRVEKRFSNGLSLLGSYTRGKLMDDASSNNSSNFNSSGTSQDATNRHNDWSLDTADVQDRLVVSGVYTLPFGRKQRFGANWNRLVDAIVGGWQANGIATFQGGFPLALSASNVANIFNPGERPNNKEPAAS